MDACCRLGEEYINKKNVLYESKNFFVTPTIGQMGIEGYVLVCSKKHYLGGGNIPEELIPELNEVLDKTKEIISKVYNSKVLVFEHGPKLGCHTGGGCLDHSHLHIVPTSIDIVDFLNKKFNMEEINNFDRLRDICKSKKSSYIFIENSDNKKYVINMDLPLPSQYIRQIIASKMNIKEWDWKAYPDYETFEKTMKKLKGKFG